MGSTVVAKPREKKSKAPERASAPVETQELEQATGAPAGVPLFLGIGLQRKLAVGAVDDPLEKQADSVAEKVMRLQDPSALTIGNGGNIVRRKCAECEEEEKLIQTKPLDGTSSQPSAAQLNLDGGTPLSTNVRSRIEPVLGADFGHVQIHNSPSDQEMAKGLRAKAFTYGNHIWLGRNQSSNDIKLMAHEAAHVVQQGAAPGRPLSIQRAEEDRPPARPPTDGNAVVLNQILGELPKGGNGSAPAAGQRPNAPSPESQGKLDPDKLSQKKGDLRTKGQPARSQPPPGRSPSSPKAKPGGSTTAKRTPPRKESLPKKPGGARSKVRAVAGSPGKHASLGMQVNATKIAGIQAQAGQVQASATAQAAALVAAAKPPVFPAAAEVSALAPAGAGVGDAGAQAQVQQILATLRAAGGPAIQQIQGRIQSAKAKLIAGANSVRQNMRSEIAQEIASLRGAFATERAALGSSLAAAQARIRAMVAAQTAALPAHGETAKNNITTLFTNHRATVEGAVQTNIAGTEKMRTSYAGYVHDRTQGQANEARQRGAAKAASYPSDERGGVQAEAATGVANRTAQEISQREPDTVSGVEKIVEAIPQQFQDKGQQALNGFDQGLPDLLSNVDQQVQTVSANFPPMGDQASQGLDALGAQLNEQLDALQTSTVARAEAIGPEAEAQIDSSLAIALSFVDATGARAAQQINQACAGALQTIKGVQHPNVKAARKLAQQVLGFVSARRKRTISALDQTGDAMAGEIGKIGATTSDGLQTNAQQAAGSIQNFSQVSSGAISKLVNGLDTGLQQVVESMDAAFAQVATRVETHLSQAVRKLQNDFSKTLGDAETKITQSVDQALAKNDEALSQLDGQMEDAASDSAWDYDHPILSTLRDIGEFVAGVIVGIVAVLLLVVVVLALAEVLIAGLVALGISAAAAALIVEIAGLALLAYGVYSAYESRSAKGQSGVEAFVGALGDVTGITAIYHSVTAEGMTPYERGKMFGEGVTNLGLLLVGGGETEAGEAEAGEVADLGELGEPTPGEPPAAGPTEPAPPERAATPEEPVRPPAEPATPEPTAEPVTPAEPAAAPAEPTAPAAEPTPAEPPSAQPTPAEPAPAKPPAAEPAEPDIPEEPKPPAAGEAPTTPQEKQVLDQTASKPSEELTPEEALTERDVASRTKGEPIDDPPFTTEKELPNGHEIEETPGGDKFKRCSKSCGIYDSDGNLVSEVQDKGTPYGDAAETGAGVAEKVGVQQGREVLADHGINPDPDWINPFENIGGSGQGFDDVLIGPDGEPVIGEYKGGSAELSEGQMERPWVQKNIDRIRAYGQKTGWTEMVDFADKLQLALDSGKLTGVTVTHTIDPGTGLPTTIVEPHGPY